MAKTSLMDIHYAHLLLNPSLRKEFYTRACKRRDSGELWKDVSSLEWELYALEDKFGVRSDFVGEAVARRKLPDNDETQYWRFINRMYRDLIRDARIMLPAAVCCVIQNDEGQILLVSRKDNPDSFGLPGGKEDPEDKGKGYFWPIIREVREETGLIVGYDIKRRPEPSLLLIYESICPRHAPEGQDFFASTFLATEWEGEISTQEKGIVKWGTWEDQSDGNFSNYNKGVQRALNDYSSDHLWPPREERYPHFLKQDKDET